MEINGPRRIDSASLRRSARTSSTGGAFTTEETPEATHAAPLTGSAPITAIDTILALQGADESGGQRKRAVSQGEKLLDLLDEVRDGLLAGGIPRHTLHQLALTIGKRRENFAEPALQHVLDEIELRARVELAKLEQAQRLHT